MALSNSKREAKLQKLAKLEGFEAVDEMFDAAVSDRVCPGICCNQTNQDRGWCETCQANTVQRCLVLADLI